jgi:hypothetical protein
MNPDTVSETLCSLVFFSFRNPDDGQSSETKRLSVIRQSQNHNSTLIRQTSAQVVTWHQLPKISSSTIAPSVINYLGWMWYNQRFDNCIYSSLQNICSHCTIKLWTICNHTGFGIRTAVNMKSKTYLLTYSVALVRKRTIPTERPPLVGEVIANFLRIKGDTWSAWWISTTVFSVF